MSNKPTDQISFHKIPFKCQTLCGFNKKIHKHELQQILKSIQH